MGNGDRYTTGAGWSSAIQPANRYARSASLVTFSDITESKRLEQSLTDFEERLRLVMEMIGDVFSRADLAMKHVFYVSPAYERNLGPPGGRIVRHPG